MGTSSCSCTNLDVKPKAVEEGVNKTQLTVLPLDRVEEFRLASEEIRWWTQCRSGDLADFPAVCGGQQMA